MSADTPRHVPAAPSGSATVAPFIMSDDAVGLIAFVVDVFGAVEVPEARTADVDGLVLHSELLLGDSVITVADRKPHWPYTPAFVRVYVDDAAATLGRAVARGARVVTEPTDFWGDVFSRFADPFGHLWWVYQHDPAAASSAWDDGDGSDDGETDGGGSDDGEADDDEADGGGGGAWDSSAADGSAPGDSWESFATPELTYINSTLMEGIESLRDPRTV